MAVRDSAPAPRRRDAAGTRARLLAAARTLFLRQGYAATGLRQIAADAGVDVTLVRRYFGSKRQLFVEATDLGEDADQIWSADGAQIPALLIRRVLAAPADADVPLFALLRSSGDPEVVERLTEQLDRSLTGPLAERVDADDARLRADLVTALMVGVGVLRTLLRKEPIASADDDRLTELFERAFRALTIDAG